MKLIRHQITAYSLVITASLALLIPSQSVGDDIEIYTSVTNGSSSTEANHNILFVMDTSGSMGFPVAGLATSGGYDPTEDYGDSTDKIYVYDTDFNFTGNTIEYSQNKCQSMNNVFSSSTTYPVYLDQGLQWQQTSDVIDGGETCDTTTTGARTFPSTTVFESDKNEWVLLLDENLPVGGGELTITVNSSKETRIYVETFRSSDTNDDDWYCYDKKAKPNRTCSGDVEDDHNRLVVWAYTKKKNTTITVSGSFGGTTTSTCTDNPDTTINSNNWKSAFINTTDSDSVFECKNDADYHGISDASGDKYVTECSYGAVCLTPEYSSASRDEISWGSSPSQYFIPGNYHDFIENGGNANIDNLLADEQNADNYCDSQSKIGDVFIDSNTGLVFECFSRITLMKNSVTNLVASLSEAPVNIGLMRFNQQDDDGTGTQGGTVVEAIKNIKDNSTFATALDNLPSTGGTPLSESLYEAYLYYSGQSLDYGRTENCTVGVCTDDAAKSEGKYVSPITASCQSNNIIFLSDGTPSSTDGDSDTEIQAAANVTSCGTTGGAGKCLDEIAGVMATQDMNTSVSGVNTVKTYTIGLEIDLALLEDAAASGNGEYFTASSSSDLEDAFRSIVVDILTDASSFVAPAVSVNAFNELQHRNEVYYALFEPSGTPRWPGNIKKYLIQDGALTDASGNNAINPTTGFFSETAKSYWDDVTDGKTVTLGGAASQLTNSRVIYTEDNSGDTILLDSTTFSDIDLGDINAGSSEERADILNWLLGIDSFDDDKDNNFTEASNFMADPLHSKPSVITYGGTAEAPQDVLFVSSNLGTLHAIDPSDNLGTELWAYLPSQHQDNLTSYIRAPNSTQHTYGLDGEMTIVTTKAAGSTAADFALEDVKLYLGERRGGRNYYGFDVSNARIASSTPLTLDNSYSTPFKKLWTITGGTTGFHDLGQTWSKMETATLSYSSGSQDVLIFSGGYDPRHDTTSYSSSETVLDDDSINTVSDYGNAIYIVNALTGALIYSIGNNDDDSDNLPLNANARDIDQHDLNLPMKDAIPSTPSVVDIDGDGSVDMIFAVDIKGHVWRIDIDKSKDITDSSFVKGGEIADLSSATELRRFYNKLDISRSNRLSGSDHLNIVVGSGYRARPSLEEAWNNRFYFLNDPYPRLRSLEASAETDRYSYASSTVGETTTARTVVEADLVETSLANPASRETATNGFYLSFDSGEKVLQRSITFNSIVTFSTFSTESGGNANTCGGNLGSSKIYALDIDSGESLLTLRDALTGDPIIHDGTVDADGNTVDENGNIVYVNDNNEIIAESISLLRTGIAADLSIILTSDEGDSDGMMLCIGTECSGSGGGGNSSLDNLEELLREGFEEGRAYRTFWSENK